MSTRITAKILDEGLKLELKIDENIITPITAIAAAAKFGLPSVPITEL